MSKMLYSEPVSAITPKQIVLDRRKFIQAAGAAALATSLPLGATQQQGAPSWLDQEIAAAQIRPPRFQDALTDFQDASQYNNFYEFGENKGDPAKYGHEFNPYPWQVQIDGECDNPGTISLQSLIGKQQLEQRIYRLRCVEAWSMVIPWIGFPLGEMLAAFKPNSKARYVAFETVVRKEEMRGQRRLLSSIKWPYVEGLRIDEAMHPLAFVAVGMYNEAIPVQNGAPIRLVLPWKYGFKSIKSIVRIHFTENEPPTTWKLSNPREYGFYSNVNPQRPHPRWSQATERRFGPKGKIERIPTAPFNGYDEVAPLYAGMDLKLFY